MSGPKILFYFSAVLFGMIGVLSLFKESEPSPGEGVVIVYPGDDQAAVVSQTAEPVESKSETPVTASRNNAPVPEVDHIDALFSKDNRKLDAIVETVTYKSSVPWKKGRPAWLVDYAKHYNTSSHFIARSLTGGPNYFASNVNNGDRFNVLRNDKEISFHLLIDTSRTKMWLYAIDEGANERYLLKSYKVGLGRKDENKASHLLTPHGTYKLGNRVAIYKPSVMGFFEGNRTEMITVFGTRWIPFDEEIENCTAPAKGFGIHGVPWTPGSEYKEQRDTIGKYESDGCIRMLTEDVEELFAIITTKKAVVQIVDDFHQAKLPGKEGKVN